MAHYNTRLPREVEIGAVRRLKYSTDIVTQDGGGEVRNARWSAPLRTYEISFPHSRRDGEIYTSVIALYEATLGGLHSFDMAEWVDDTEATIVKVRFDTPLQITGYDSQLDHIDTLTLVEVRA